MTARSASLLATRRGKLLLLLLLLCAVQSPALQRTSSRSPLISTDKEI
ncbi:MAG TPA: hypothetical protein VGD83_17655 [Streptosporangiaceae bacterium]